MSELELLFKYLDAMGTLKVRRTNSCPATRRAVDRVCMVWCKLQSKRIWYYFGEAVVSLALRLAPRSDNRSHLSILCISYTL